MDGATHAGVAGFERGFYHIRMMPCARRVRWSQDPPRRRSTSSSFLTDLADRRECSVVHVEGLPVHPSYAQHERVFMLYRERSHHGQLLAGQ